jgi:hypothetical protein
MGTTLRRMRRSTKSWFVSTHAHPSNPQAVTPKIRTYLIRNFNSIRGLDISLIPFEILRQVMELVASFPLLEHLELHTECIGEIEVVNSSYTLAPHQIPRRLRSLNIG